VGLLKNPEELEVGGTMVQIWAVVWKEGMYKRKRMPIWSGLKEEASKRCRL
jgi:hypothetical protein